MRTIVITTVVLCCIAYWGFYLWHFCEAQLSDQSSDWGAFANYIGNGLNLLSIGLLYITYKEQRHANLISQIDNKFHDYFLCIEQMQKENAEHINLCSEKITAHFNCMLDKKKSLSVDDCQLVLRNYYSNIRCDNPEKASVYSYMGYLENVFDFIRDSKLEETTKKEYYKSVICLLDENTRIVLLGHILTTEHKDIINYIFFPEEDTNVNSLLRYVLNKACGRECNINQDNLRPDVEDHSKEGFYDTLERFKDAMETKI